MSIMKFPNRIKELREILGMSQTELGDMVARTQTLISKLEQGHIDFDMSMADNLAKALGVSVTQLRDNNLHKNLRGSHSHKDSMLKSSATQSREGFRFGPSLIPLYGRANGSGDRMLLHPDSEIRKVPSHPAQRDYKPELQFAMEVSGSSMEPMFNEGDWAFGVLHQAPSKEKPCFIECEEETLIKLFVRKTDKEIVYRQFNPAREIKISLNKVKGLHSVVGNQFIR